MYHIGKDVRKKKSADLIAEGLRRIMRSGSTEKLTIASVCQEAGVSRVTFYRLFDTVDDVMRYLCDGEFDMIFQAYQKEREQGIDGTPVQVYSRFLLKEEDGLIAVLRHKKTTLLVESHIRMLKRYAPVFFPQMDPSSDEFVYFIQTRSWMLVGVLSAWLETDRRASAEEVDRWLSEQMKFLYRGPGSSSGQT